MDLRRDRVLLVFYGVGLLVGAREFLVSRERAPDDWQTACEASAASCFSIESRADAARDPEFWNRHAEMAEVVARINPGDPDTRFLEAMQALADGDEERFVERMDEALRAGVKHNDMLLQYYAQYLLDAGEDHRRVNLAVNRWRENHPFSTATLSLRLGAGPRSDEAADVLRQSLARVPWVASSELTRAEEEGVDVWRVLLSFRPGQVVDMRQAVEAVTLLALPEEHRSTYDIVCVTMQDCSARRRTGR